MGVCGNKKKGCKKLGKAQNKGTNGKLYCTIACSEEDGATLCEEAKATKKLANAKSNAKTSAALLATKRAINDAHNASGGNIDPNLTLDEVRRVSLGLVSQTLKIVGKNHFYIAAGRDYRTEDEVFAFATNRGNGKSSLVHGPNNERMTPGMLKKKNWRYAILDYATNNEANCDSVECTCHEIMYKLSTSIWLRNGAGGVHHGEDGTIYTFNLAVAFGPSAGIRFRAEHPRSLSEPRFASREQLMLDLDLVPRPIALLPFIPAIEQMPTATRQVVERNATSRRIIRDEDDDGGGKPRAIEERVIEQPSKKPPLVDLTNDDDIKPKAKAQRTLIDLYARKPPAIKLNNLRTAPRPRALPRIQAVQVAKPNASSQLIIRDEDDNGGGKLRAINDDVIEPRKRAGSRFRILESDGDDDDGAIKPSAMVATPPKKKTTTKKATTISNVDYFASMVSANSPQKKKWKKYEFDFWKKYESESDDDGASF